MAVRFPRYWTTGDPELTSQVLLFLFYFFLHGVEKQYNNFQSTTEIFLQNIARILIIRRNKNSPNKLFMENVIKYKEAFKDRFLGNCLYSQKYCLCLQEGENMKNL